jgi:hypothetical protein
MRTSAVFSVSPVYSPACARSASSIFSVVLIHTLMPVLDASVKAPRSRAHPFPAPKSACPLRLLDSGSGTDSGFRDDTSGVELARAIMSGLIGIHGSEVLRPNHSDQA